MYALNVSMEAGEVCCIYTPIRAIKTKSSGFFLRFCCHVYLVIFGEQGKNQQGHFHLPSPHIRE